MSKVMSILEKYNLVEKVNKGEAENTISNEENNVEMDEVSNDENNIPKAGEPEPVVKEKSFSLETDMEYGKKMTIAEIYSLFALENSNINTIFMLQNLTNALPQNLPKDVIKQSVINIIDASNIDLSKLLSDGDQRMEALVKVMDGYNKQTNKCIIEYKEEITKLSGLINNFQEQIKIKEAMLEDQVYLIKSEAQKIGGIVDYFSK